MIAYCRHLKKGWILAGRQVGSGQFVKEGDRNILRNTGSICDRTEGYCFTLLSVVSSTIGRAIIENVGQRPITLSLDGSPSPKCRVQPELTMP